MSVDLVPGELRGYRQFLLHEGGLLPVARLETGPWEPGRHVAVCAAGAAHPPPSRDCTCGLYGWYHPLSARGAYGGALAVVAASGRVVLGDHGFRAAAARVEAVTLPAPLRWRPRAAAREADRLRARYPGLAVHRSSRAMLRAFPPQDLASLGALPPDRTRVRCRRAAYVLWAVFVVGAYAVLLLPHDPVARLEARVWPLVLLGFVAWQAALIALVLRGQPRDLPPPRVARPPDPPAA